jgi:hypothetical protein
MSKLVLIAALGLLGGFGAPRSAAQGRAFPQHRSGCRHGQARVGCSGMNKTAANRSPELDEVRRLLFPNLRPDDGWAQIDRAFSGASDPRRVRRIEERAKRLEIEPDAG